jgi:phytoene dehydrogenase-like protein
MNAHVDQILVEEGRAVGVRLKNGEVVRARRAVVSNATPFDTVKMLGQVCRDYIEGKACPRPL